MKFLYFRLVKISIQISSWISSVILNTSKIPDIKKGWYPVQLVYQCIIYLLDMNISTSFLIFVSLFLQKFVLKTMRTGAAKDNIWYSSRERVCIGKTWPTPCQPSIVRLIGLKRCHLLSNIRKMLSMALYWDGTCIRR